MKAMIKAIIKYFKPAMFYFDSGGGDVTYQQSPQQAAIYVLLYPVISKISSFATGRPWSEAGVSGGRNGWDEYPDSTGPRDKNGFPVLAPGQPYPDDMVDYPTDAELQAGYAADAGPVTSLWDIPELPEYPDMPDMYQVPGLYTYNNLPPELKASMMAPYQDAEKQMLETFGSRGAAGAPGAGYSGSAGAAGGEFWADAANQLQMQGYQMGQPLWQAQLGANKMGYLGEMQRTQGQYGQAMQGWQAQLQENMYPYTALPGMLGGTYGDTVVSPYEPSMASQMAPYMMAAAMMFSDIRLKRNIKRVGTYNGLDVIEFNYIWGGPKHRGLIAQQVQKVRPDAVGSINGYLYINYGAL